MLTSGTKNLLEEKGSDNCCCCCQLTDTTSGAYKHGGEERRLYYKRAYDKYISKLFSDFLVIYQGQNINEKCDAKLGMSLKL